MAAEHVTDNHSTVYINLNLLLMFLVIFKLSDIQQKFVQNIPNVKYTKHFHYSILYAFPYT